MHHLCLHLPPLLCILIIMWMIPMGISWNLHALPPYDVFISSTFLPHWIWSSSYLHSYSFNWPTHINCQVPIRCSLFHKVFPEPQMGPGSCHLLDSTLALIHQSFDPHVSGFLASKGLFMGIQEFPTSNTGLDFKVLSLALPLPVSDNLITLDQCVYVTQDIAGSQATYCKVIYSVSNVSPTLYISVSIHWDGPRWAIVLYSTFEKNLSCRRGTLHKPPKRQKYFVCSCAKASGTSPVKNSLSY